MTDDARATGIGAALAYGLAFFVAILWIEVRFRFLAHGVNLLLPYALLLAIASCVAYWFSGLRAKASRSRLRYAWPVLEPLAILASAGLLTATAWLSVGLAVRGELGNISDHLELTIVLPVAFVLNAWPLLLPGLIAATACLNVRR